MLHGWRRLVACLLALVLTMSAVPTPAIAAGLLSLTPQEGEEVLSMLEEIAGSEDEAEQFYEVLQQYNLLDEGGNPVESWETTMDGEDVTAEEVQALLDSGDYDPGQTVIVDGTSVTLENLKTMFEIEAYIARLQNTYFTEHEWTDEQKDSLESLVEQLQTEGLQVTRSSGDLVFPSGADHDQRVIVPESVTVEQGVSESVTATIQVKLAHAAKQPVTLKWRLVAGSSGADVQSGELTFKPGEGTLKIIRVTCKNATYYPWNGSRTAVVEYEMVSGALFDNGLTGDSTVINVKYEESFGDIANKSDYPSSGGYFPNYSQIPSYAALFGSWLPGADSQSVGKDVNELSKWLSIKFDSADQAFTVDSTSSNATRAFTSADDSAPMYASLDFRWTTLGEQTDLNFCSQLTAYAEITDNGTRSASATMQFPEGISEAIRRGVFDKLYVEGTYTYNAADDGEGTVTVKWGNDTLFTANDTGDISGIGSSDSFSFEKDINPDEIFKSGTDTIYWRDAIPLSISLKRMGAISVTLRYVLVGEENPTVSLSNNPEGTFIAGQKIPVSLSFDKPVNGDTLELVANGRKLPSQNAAEDTSDTPFDDRHTFLYEVGKTDGMGIQATELQGFVPHGRGALQTVGFNNELMTADRIVIPKSLAVDSLSAEVGGTSASPTFDVKLTFSDDEALTNLLSDEFVPKDDGTFESTTLKARCGDSYAPFVLSGRDITGATATASFPINANTGNGNITHLAEIYLDDQVVHGFYITAEQVPVNYVTSANLSVDVAVLKGDGNGDDYELVNGLIYPEDEPQIIATSAVTGDALTWADMNKVTTGTLSGDTVVPDDNSAHFAWVSTNTDVANIDVDGRVTPTGAAGEVAFRFVALNGGVPGKQAYTETKTLSFGVGLTPFLAIPNKQVSIREGQDAVVLWSSNISDKNGANPTSFSIELRKGYETIELPGEVATVTGTAAAPAARVVIPSKTFRYSYGDSGANEYTVTVSVEFGGKVYSEQATITLNPQPAVVTLADLPSYYITDAQGAVDISWTVDHLARYAEGVDDLFEFKITKDGQDAPVDVVTDPGQAGGAGKYGGSFRLDDIEVDANTSDPDSYRDVYTVTARAKNGSDSTWSFDSFILYVYDADALQIMVDGIENGELAMSNRDELTDGKTYGATNSGAWQKAVLALGRDISLKNVITANYGQYAWAELADQIEWASTNPDAATLSYQQGALYEDIRNLTYTSYRPTSDFVIAGLDDGATNITARHKLTGMTDTLPVTVETLENHLYLFQCYPQSTVTLTFDEYTNASRTATRETTITSAEDGAAAYYSEHGIASNVYCASTVDGAAYRGTFYLSELQTGEGDPTKLELYPCNNLDMRRAAYAYLYIKKPDGTPYQGDITFRGGVYVNGDYQESALFQLNGGASVSTAGDKDTTVTLGADGRLEVTMDQSQWEVDDLFGADVEYVFQIEQGGDGGGTEYYPLLATIDATVNEGTFVGAGEAVVSLRENENANNERAPFVAAQVSSYSNYGSITNLLDETGAVGPSDSCPEAVLDTVVMWWGDALPEEGDPANSLRLMTKNGTPIADGEGESTLSNTLYPFSDIVMTQYTVHLNAQSLSGVLGSGRSASAVLEYYRDGKTLYRREELPFDICNMLGKGTVEDQASLLGQLQDMGKMANTDATTQYDFGDMSVETLLKVLESDTYTTGDDKLFSLQVAPTSDPRKFLGFVEVNVGNMSDKNQITGVYAVAGQKQDIDYEPGIGEIMMMVMAKTPLQYGQDQIDDFNRSKRHEGVRNISFDLGGYAECLIYLSEVTGDWEMQILNGGFNAGGGLSYTWNFNAIAGIVPFTASITAGGVGEVSMDVLTAAWKQADDASVHGLGNDFLTELRLYLYLRFFAGVGWDYAVIAAKFGFFGQINLDMQFQWLNRPYLYDSSLGRVNVADGGSAGTLNGQHFKLDGQAGMEVVFRLLFVSYEQVLFSKSFKVFDEDTGAWKTIQTNWEKNQKAQQGLIEGLAANGSLSLMNVGGTQVAALNLAPTVEPRDYVENGPSVWGDGGGIQLLSLDEENGLKSLEQNTYAYANPVVTDDGELLVYLTHQNSEDVEKTRVAFATKQGDSYQKGDTGEDNIVSDKGYGDSQVAVDGVGQSAVATWTRQGQDINKDSNAVLTREDQIMMQNNADVYAGIWDGTNWKTSKLSESDSADLAPVVATNGKSDDRLRAVVAWRSVSSSGSSGAAQVNATEFDQRDAIVYKVYDGSRADEENGGWSELQTLYNGTSGGVKAIVADMLDDGTAAVAYTLDKDNNDSTTTDREIAYAVIDSEGGEVARNVEVTNDAYLDENPQITTSTFPGAEDEQRFVLGWYSEQAVSADTAGVLDGGSVAASDERVSDIRLVDFDGAGAAGQLLPDSISEISQDGEVNITSNFRFTKNADSIEDLSILWVERAQAVLTDIETDGGQAGTMTDEVDWGDLTSGHDELRGVKFYTAGQNNGAVRITDVVDVAVMDDHASIDHFDAYVNNSVDNEVKAVILGTTYGENGETVEKTSRTMGGDTVRYTVPKQTYAMYTATQAYTDDIEVTGVAVDYGTVRLGATTQIQFVVKNAGVHAVNKIKITVGEGDNATTTTYGEDGGLSLMPGESIQLAAECDVPEDKVVDPKYTVLATFDQSKGVAGEAEVETEANLLETFMNGVATSQVEGTAYLNLPDVEVAEAGIVSEEGGERDILVKLNNAADAVLKGSGRRVRIGFYSDATCETPLDGVTSNAGEVKEGVLELSSDDVLGMIDEGGYSALFTVDATSFLDEGTSEIPETGVPVYVKAEVVESATADGETRGEVLGEPIYSNNYANVTVENLAVREGEDVSVDAGLTVADDSSMVTVDLKNNTLSQKTTGNVIVALLDAGGNVIAEQQSYVPGTGEGQDNGLVTLSGEKSARLTFTFSGEGAANAADVRVTYSDAKLEQDNAGLALVEADGVTFTYDEASGTWVGETASGDLSETLITIVPENLDAAVTVNGGPYETAFKTALVRGTNTLRVVVTAPDGKTTAAYTIVIGNGEAPSVPTPTGHEVAVSEGVRHGSVTVSPTRATAGQAVTITPEPDEGYEVAAVTVTAEDGTEVAVTEGEGGTWAFAMPGGPVEVAVEFRCLGGELCPTRPFGDVSASAWYHGAMDWAVEEGLLAGFDDGTLGPEATLSRGQLATVLYRRAGEPASDAGLTFADCDPGAFYAKAVAWAAEEGVILGYGDGTYFGPDDPVTREQLATILWRMAGEPEADGGLSAFPDGGDATAYAVPALAWATKTGVLAGFGSGELAPTGRLNRAMLAAMLMRLDA